MNAHDAIYAALGALDIPYERLEHERADTMEQLKDAERALGCVIPKNLFLAPRNQSAFYLCLVRPDYAFRTADISKQIGASRLSFAPEDKLDTMLHTHPGAISPMGLLFDPENEIRLLVDERLLREDKLGFHPNDNCETLSMKANDFFNVFLKHTRHAPTIVHMD